MATHVQIRIRSLVIGVLLVGAAASAAALARHTEIHQTAAYLAIADGVCLSGSTEWVAQAAAKSAARGTTMLAMSGDAF
jgi:hypothetical protein